MMAAVKPADDNSPHSPRDQRIAALALLFATTCWGAGFTWAKAGGDAINHAAALPHDAALGPLLLLGSRFFLAGIAWFILFPRARRGWTLRSAGRTLLLGALLSSGLIPQHVGLGQTSEAVSAFLTSLTIVFIPLIATLALRRPPSVRAWIAVGLAVIGVWLLTGAAPGGGFGRGETLGLLCAITFSIDVIAVNVIVPRDDPFRITGGQFIVVALIAFAFIPFARGGAALTTHVLMQFASIRAIWLNCLLLAVGSSLIAFGILNHFQPRIDPTRAALIYLMEPIFASVYAYFATGRNLNRVQWLGAAIVIVANGAMELLERRDRTVVIAPEVS